MEIDVVIIGGGPVGLTMKLMLQYHGVDALLVEKGNGIISMPKVGTVGVRSMEIFSKLGLKHSIENCGWPKDHLLDISWTTSLGGYELFRLKKNPYSSRKLSNYSAELEQVCPHNWLCPILAKAISDVEPESLLLNTEMTSFLQSDAGVIANVQNRLTKSKMSIRAKYLIACDGAKSSVRNHCNVKFEQFHESTFFQNILFEAPYLKDLLGNSNALVHFLVSSDGFRFPLRSMDGRTLYRLTVSPQEGISPYDLVMKVLSFDTPIYIKSSVKWELSHRILDKFRDKNIFFAGDAAHVISPSGGFGMNTGIADTENLAWKISAVLKGEANDSLLDSYGEERRPIALKSLEKSKESLSRTLNRTVPSGINKDTPEGDEVRKKFSKLLIKQQVGKEFDAPDVHLGLGYSSPIIMQENNEDDKGDWQSKVLVGYRAPHVFIGEESILTLFKKKFVILCFSDKNEYSSIMNIVKKQNFPIEVKLITDQKVRKIYCEKYYLIRPDGYVSWKSDSLEEKDFSIIKNLCAFR